MRRAWGIGLAAAALAALGAPGLRTAQASFQAPTFVVAPLPQATGVQYAAGVTRNEDVEPGIAVDGGGTFWVGSNLDVNTSGDPRTATLIAGMDIWKSTNGGRDYQWVAAPFNFTGNTPGAGGEDSDLTVATEKNATGYYNIYATSLYLAASNMAISQDGGATFVPVSVGGIPAQDRPWLTAEGPCTFYLTYHQLPLFSPVVNKYDICNVQNNGAGFSLNPVQSTSVFLSNTAPGLTNGFNKPFADSSATSPGHHNLYIPMEACALSQPADFLNNVVLTAEQVPTCPQGVNTQVEVAVSSDGGVTFNDYVVALNSNGEQQVWPTSLGIDAAGTVYVAWGDNYHSYFSRSTDQARTWSKPVRIDAAPVQSTAYPTIVGGPAGTVEVAYYGTSVAGNTNDDKAMGVVGNARSAQWHLYWAKSTDSGATFNTVQVSGVNHTGALCTKGAACSGAGTRNLYDDFGIAISPTTGRASIAFDADQTLKAVPDGKVVDPFTAFATEGAPLALPPTPVPSPVAKPVLPNTEPASPAELLLLAVAGLVVGLGAGLGGVRLRLRVRGPA